MKKTIIPIIILVSLSILGGIFIFYKSADNSLSFLDKNNLSKKCGDKVCDYLEQKDSQLCPQDCKSSGDYKTDSDASLESEKSLGSNHFGFLNAYGQDKNTLYAFWEKQFKLDLIKESSNLVKDLQVDWNRISFFYPMSPDKYTVDKFNQTNADGLNPFVTILAEEASFQEKEYSDWLGGVLDEYSSKAKYWQINNEVGKRGRYEDPENYLKLLKTSSEVIRKKCSDCKIVMGSTIPDKNYYETIIEKGDAYVDAYDFHIFSEEEMEEIKNFSANISKPLFVTEMATYSGDLAGDRFSLQTEKEQAEKLIKWQVKSFYNGADYIFWNELIEWYKFQGKADGIFDLTGLVYNGVCNSVSTNDVCEDENIDKGILKKKEAYYALKTLVSKIDEFSEVIKISEGQYKFLSENKEVYALWCDSSNCSVSSAISGDMQVTDYRGNQKILSSDQIKLSSSPIFVE